MSVLQPVWKAAAPWAGERAPDLVRRVPTMLRPGEAKFYQWLARSMGDGDGAVVDLGAFIGGSSARLAYGLACSGSTAPLHVYDRFQVSQVLKKRMLYPAGVAPFDGSSIESHARAYLRPWRDRTRFHPGLIERIGWDGTPIRLLCIDAFKRADTTDRMVESFFPALVPGRSIIVHQDFLHPAQPWIIALMHRFGDVFEPLAQIGPSTLAFRCTRRIAPSHIRRARVAHLSDDDLLAAISATRRRLRGWGIGHRLNRVEVAVRTSPLCRIAHRMSVERPVPQARIKAA